MLKSSCRGFVRLIPVMAALYRLKPLDQKKTPS